MANGKRTCKILKEIRRQIAAANCIDLIIEECRHKGDCRGTCPRCEAEVRYLEEQLRERRLTGRAVALVGVSAGMLLMAGCSSSTTKPAAEEANENTPTQKEVVEVKDQNTEDSSSETVSDYDEFDEIEEVESPINEDILTTIMQGGASPENVSDAEDPSLPDDFIMGEYDDDGITDTPLDPENDIYERIDTMPQFPGGDSALMDFINSYITCPISLEESSKQRVIVKFVVKRDGSIGDAIVVRSADPDLDKEAVRVVKTLPNFEPGQLNGQPVNVWFTMPVDFKPQKLQID